MFDKERHRLFHQLLCFNKIGKVSYGKSYSGKLVAQLSSGHLLGHQVGKTFSEAYQKFMKFIEDSRNMSKINGNLPTNQ